MPRRVYTYSSELGWGSLNLLATIGAFVLAASVLLFFINVWHSLRAGERAAANPWGASGLEWATDSPPPHYNFPHIPVVESSDPLWDHPGELPVAHGLRLDRRELLLTTVGEAQPVAKRSAFSCRRCVASVAAPCHRALSAAETSPGSPRPPCGSAAPTARYRSASAPSSPIHATPAGDCPHQTRRSTTSPP
jgi:hypothetical protein